MSAKAQLGHDVRHVDVPRRRAKHEEGRRRRNVQVACDLLGEDAAVDAARIVDRQQRPRRVKARVLVAGAERRVFLVRARDLAFLAGRVERIQTVHLLAFSA